MPGHIFYAGPSALDGARIVGIATYGSRNAKTGPMVQTWILRADRAPHVAAYDGTDASVCGDCPHRWDGAARTCYVNVSRAPQSVYAAWLRGTYPHASPILIAERGPVRVGSYGDPGALPGHVVRALASGPHGHTGYTHRWRERPDLRPWLMASTDSAAEDAVARAAGWRTFRVRASNAFAFGRVGSTAGLVECVADSHDRQCIDCGLCAGSSLPAKSVWISAHGVSGHKVGRALPVLP
jgi:hypothetical protein